MKALKVTKVLKFTVVMSSCTENGSRGTYIKENKINRSEYVIIDGHLFFEVRTHMGAMVPIHNGECEKCKDNIRQIIREELKKEKK
jgi:hypothetical protein